MDKIDLTDTVPDSLNNERLDRALANMWPQYSREQHKQWITQSVVSVDEKTIRKPSYKVSAGQTIEVNASLQTQTPWQAQHIPINVEFEDKHLLIINKAANLVVHPGAGNPDHTLVNALLYHAPALANLPRCGLIHRLDKDTTGLLVIAKTLESYSQLIKSMQEREIHRHYQAIVQGVVISGGTIEQPIGRHAVSRTKMAVTSGGKVAITHFLVGKKFTAHSLLNIELETGRTHQIRVHFSHLGYPIVGDKTYKKQIALENKITPALQTALNTFPRQALHAKKLTLRHPINGTPLEFDTPLPEDMVHLIDALTRDQNET